MKKEQFLYQQVYHELKNKILNGELGEGLCLPLAGELAKEYSMSTITINHALDALKKEGYISRVKGKGSFVQYPVEESQKAKEEELQEDHPLAEDGMSERIDQKMLGEKMIGVVLEHVSSCFGLDMMYAMDNVAQQAGYRLYVRFSYGKREKETEEIEFLKELGVCGIIVMPCHGLYYNTDILKLVIEDFPVVVIDKKMEGIPVSSVRTDSHLAMRELVDYLIKKGKRKIGFITVEENDTSSIRERRRGFWDAIDGAGLSHMPECTLKNPEKQDIFSDDFNFNHRDKMELYLTKNKELDAVICAEYGITRCLKERGSQEGIEICCIDEDYQSPGGPHFTHIRQDERSIAAKAIQILLKQVEKDSSYVQGDYLVPGHFKKV